MKGNALFVLHSRSRETNGVATKAEIVRYFQVKTRQEQQNGEHLERPNRGDSKPESRSSVSHWMFHKMRSESSDKEPQRTLTRL